MLRNGSIGCDVVMKSKCGIAGTGSMGLAFSIRIAFLLIDLTGVGGLIRKFSFLRLELLAVLCIDGEFVSDGTGTFTILGFPTWKMQTATANLTTDCNITTLACWISSAEKSS